MVGREMWKIMIVINLILALRDPLVKFQNV